MKPTKNKIYCLSCSRYKMLFESQNKAENFIKYNRDTIFEKNHKAPVRSYFCTFCAGWHVTSNPFTEKGERLDERDKSIIKNLISSAENKKKQEALSKKISEALKETWLNLNIGDLIRAEELLNICHSDLTEMRSYPTIINIYARQQSEIEKATKSLMILKTIKNMSDEEVENLQSTQELPFDRKALIVAVKNLKAINQLNLFIPEIEMMLYEGTSNQVKQKIKYCKNIAGGMAGPGINALKSSYLVKLNAFEKKLKAQQAPRQPERSSTEPISLTAVKEYKATILSLIERLETIEAKFDAGDYATCDNLIDVGLIILDELNQKDNNTKLIRSQLNKWKDKVKLREV